MAVKMNRVCGGRVNFRHILALVAGNNQVDIAKIIIFFDYSIRCVECCVIQVQDCGRGEVEAEGRLASGLPLNGNLTHYSGVAVRSQRT